MEEDGRSGGGGGSGAPAWMATFADMMSLLLTFFVLLLSFATMDIVKFRDAMGSIQQALGFMPAGTGMFQHTNKPTIYEKPLATSSLTNGALTSEMVNEMSDAISEELKEVIKQYGLEDEVEVEKSKRGVILRMRGKVLFNAGEAELKESAYPILDKIADLMRKFPSNVSIEGHTDNIPVNGGRYSSNWELSVARAISALRYFQKLGDIDLQRINIAGFADTHPIADNSTPEGRAKNRRVEFVFYKE